MRRIDPQTPEATDLRLVAGGSVWMDYRTGNPETGVAARRGPLWGLIGWDRRDGRFVVRLMGLENLWEWARRAAAEDNGRAEGGEKPAGGPSDPEPERRRTPGQAINPLIASAAFSMESREGEPESKSARSWRSSAWGSLFAANGAKEEGAQGKRGRCTTEGAEKTKIERIQSQSPRGEHGPPGDGPA
jgi:hypothetical protein